MAGLQVPITAAFKLCIKEIWCYPRIHHRAEQVGVKKLAAEGIKGWLREWEGVVLEHVFIKGWSSVGQ
jgi:hypothetical protein